MVLLSFLVMNSTGCILLDLARIPLRLLFSLFSSLGSLVGLADVTPTQDPPPIVQNVGGEQWLVTGLSPDAPCTIVCSAPGFETRTYAWPRDFVGHGEEVAVRLERSK
jgi:hypothetical protein